MGARGRSPRNSLPSAIVGARLGSAHAVLEQRRRRGASMRHMDSRIAVRVIGCNVAFVLAFLAPDALADTFLNCGSSEPKVQGDPETLWCDDFEDGDMVVDGTGDANAANDGWMHTPYAPTGSFPDPAGTSFGRCGG